MIKPNSRRKWASETASDRLEETFTRIAHGGKGIANVFTEVFADEARAQIDTLGNSNALPLGGALVSIKDLLDVRGHVTRAGSPALMDKPPAGEDAECVASLRAAGAVLVGHTNMTELAYSGIGMNPYFGTPENTLYPGCAPGGSSSGGGVSVALGLCDIAIGSDTGGSIRIPAAFNGLVGFKPTQTSISRQGGVALSTTLDTFGPIARTVADCAECWRVMAGVQNSAKAGDTSTKPVLVVPTNFGRDRLDREVEQGFAKAREVLAKAGFTIVEEHLPSLDYYQDLPAWQVTAYEALHRHKATLDEHAGIMDPRVANRIRKAETISDADYQKIIGQRSEFIIRFENELAGRYLLLPTVAVLPPSMEVLADDKAYSRLNALALRNTSMGNFADSCSISLPYHFGGDTIGIMLTAAAGRDELLLSLAARMEAILIG